jgi:hypothetical protein
MLIAAMNLDVLIVVVMVASSSTGLKRNLQAISA